MKEYLLSNKFAHKIWQRTTHSDIHPLLSVLTIQVHVLKSFPRFFSLNSYQYTSDPSLPLCLCACVSLHLEHLSSSFLDGHYYLHLNPFSWSLLAQPMLEVMEFRYAISWSSPREQITLLPRNSHLETGLLSSSGFCSPWGKNLHQIIFVFIRIPKAYSGCWKNIWWKNSVSGPCGSFCLSLKQLIRLSPSDLH